MINSEDVVKILLSNCSEDEIFCLVWIGMRNKTIFDFIQKYQIQLNIDYEIPKATIDILYYTYGMKNFKEHGIEFIYEG